MKKLTGIIMIAGVIWSVIYYLNNASIRMSAVQDIELMTTSLLMVVGSYVLARGIDNLSK
jgi:hypothetical protein